MPLQNFVDGTTPVIGATWLNKVDVLLTTVFNQANTAALARAAIGSTTVGDALFITVSATAARTTLGATAIGDALFITASQAAALSTIGAAALAGSATQNFAAQNLTADKITFSAGTITRAPVTLVSGPVLTTPVAGSSEYESGIFYDTPTASNRAVREVCHFTCLTTDFTGSDVNTAQPFFSSSQDVITVPTLTTYEFEAIISMVRSAGTTSHTIALLFGGTATFTSLGYMASVTSTNGNVLGAPSNIFGLVATAVVVTGASTTAAENNLIHWKGLLRVNVAGTIIPQFIYSAAPGGAPTIRANSYFKLTPLGSNTVASVGNWS